MQSDTFVNCSIKEMPFMRHMTSQTKSTKGQQSGDPQDLMVQSAGEATGHMKRMTVEMKTTALATRRTTRKPKGYERRSWRAMQTMQTQQCLKRPLLVHHHHGRALPVHQAPVPRRRHLQWITGTRCFQSRKLCLLTWQQRQERVLWSARLSRRLPRCRLHTRSTAREKASDVLCCCDTRTFRLVRFDSFVQLRVLCNIVLNVCESDRTCMSELFFVVNRAGGS